MSGSWAVRRSWGSFSLFTSIALASVSARASSLQYHLTDLGTLGGDTSAANGMNNLGQIVGYSTTAAGKTDGFLYSSGSMTDLGQPYGGYTTAADIKNNEQIPVVGFNATSSSGKAFLYYHGTY